MMDPESACALLYRLADLRMTITDPGDPSPGRTLGQQEQEIIVLLLTELLQREATDSEIQAATYSR